MVTGWRFWNVLLSGLLFAYASYQILMQPDLRSSLPALLSQLPVLGFIWFCDFWSSWLGPLIGSGHHAKSVDTPSPAWLIAFFGWLILLTVLSLALGAWS